MILETLLERADDIDGWKQDDMTWDEDSIETAWFPYNKKTHNIKTVDDSASFATAASSTLSNSPTVRTSNCQSPPKASEIVGRYLNDTKEVENDPFIVCCPSNRNSIPAWKIQKHRDCSPPCPTLDDGAWACGDFRLPGSDRIFQPPSFPQRRLKKHPPQDLEYTVIQHEDSNGSKKGLEQWAKQVRRSTLPPAVSTLFRSNQKSNYHPPPVFTTSVNLRPTRTIVPLSLKSNILTRQKKLLDITKDGFPFTSKPPKKFTSKENLLALEHDNGESLKPPCASNDQEGVPVDEKTPIFTKSFYVPRHHRDDKNPAFIWSREQSEKFFTDSSIVVVTGWSESDTVDTYYVHRGVVGIGPRGSDYLLDVMVDKASEVGTSSTIVLELDRRAVDVFPDMLDYMYGFNSEPLKITTATAVSLRYLSDFLGVPTMFEEVNEVCVGIRFNYLYRRPFFGIDHRLANCFYFYSLYKRTCRKITFTYT